MPDVIQIRVDVLDALPGDPLAWIVYGILQMSGPVSSQRAIAEMCGMNEATIRRAMHRLADAGLNVDRAIRARKPRDSRGGKRAIRAESSRAGDPLVVGNELFPTGTSTVVEADAPNAAVELVKRVWNARNPKPVTAFGRLVKMTERFLAAGWAEADLEQAMIAAPTISDGWVEAWLNRKQKSARKAPAHAHAGRDEPTGRVKL